MKILVTGGAGFIGSSVIRTALESTNHSIINYDSLTYAGNLQSVEGAALKHQDRYTFVKGDICNQELFSQTLDTHQPDAIMHLAAESHVDRSIDGPAEFINTNITGTFSLLQASLKYWRGLEEGSKKARFRFHHISTDEVFGSLGETGYFTEETPYSPRSPYSASKAASDHLVNAWFHTFGLPVVTTNCSNNYGPYQFPEKLIPLITLNAKAGKKLPVYGDGSNVRDWLYVDDHARALLLVLEKGKLGETYNIGGKCEKKNLDVVHTICDTLDHLSPIEGLKRRELVEFVKDRPGHDQRYAIDPTKIERELGFKPQETFESGIKKTVEWYLENNSWIKGVQEGSYRQERLGLSK